MHERFLQRVVISLQSRVIVLKHEMFEPKPLRCLDPKVRILVVIEEYKRFV